MELRSLRSSRALPITGYHLLPLRCLRGCTCRKGGSCRTGLGCSVGLGYHSLRASPNFSKTWRIFSRTEAGSFLSDIKMSFLMIERVDLLVLFHIYVIPALLKNAKFARSFRLFRVPWDSARASFAAALGQSPPPDYCDGPHAAR